MTNDNLGVLVLDCYSHHIGAAKQAFGDNGKYMYNIAGLKKEMTDADVGYVITSFLFPPVTDIRKNYPLTENNKILIPSGLIVMKTALENKLPIVLLARHDFGSKEFVSKDNAHFNYEGELARLCDTYGLDIAYGGFNADHNIALITNNTFNQDYAPDAHFRGRPETWKYSLDLLKESVANRDEILRKRSPVESYMIDKGYISAYPGIESVIVEANKANKISVSNSQ